MNGIHNMKKGNISLQAKIIGISIIVIILVTIISAGIFMQRSNSNELSVNIAAKYCQEFINNKGLLNSSGYNSNNIDLIDLSNYYPSFYKDNSDTGMHLLQWNGKNKVTDTKLTFSCWISGNNDSYIIHSIKASNVTLYSADNL